MIKQPIRHSNQHHHKKDQHYAMLSFVLLLASYVFSEKQAFQA